MPYEKIYDSEVIEGKITYLNVNWINSNLKLSIKEEIPEFPRQFVNKSCNFTQSELEEIQSVIYEANEAAGHYGYWVSDVLYRVLGVSEPYTDSPYDFKYKYTLAYEILEHTWHLSYYPRGQLVRPKDKTVVLTKDSTNKALKTLKRAARAVFGKNEW